MAPMRIKITPEAGQMLAERRKELKFTQDQVADFAGVTRGFISQIERGDVDLSIPHCLALSVALRLQVREIDPRLAAAMPVDGLSAAERDLIFRLREVGEGDRPLLEDFLQFLAWRRAKSPPYDYKPGPPIKCYYPPG